MLITKIVKTSFGDLSIVVKRDDGEIERAFNKALEKFQLDLWNIGYFVKEIVLGEDK